MNHAHIAVSVATIAAWLVSHRRKLVQQSSEPAVYVLPINGAAWWRLDVWLDGPEHPEGCLNIDVLGHHVEVFYVRRDVPLATAGTC